jgi:hypothetical protein
VACQWGPHLGTSDGTWYPPVLFGVHHLVQRVFAWFRCYPNCSEMAAMATTLSLAGRAPCAAPSSSSICTTRAAAGASQQLGGFVRRTPHSSFVSRAAGSGGIEPDLDDDNRDIWATAGEDMVRVSNFSPHGPFASILPCCIFNGGAHLA